MGRTKKIRFENLEECKKFIRDNLTFEQLVDEVAKQRMKEQEDNLLRSVKITLTQEQLTNYFHIKEANSRRGRKKKE